MNRYLLILAFVFLSISVMGRDFSYEYKGQTLAYTVIDEEAKTCMTKAGVSNWQSGNNLAGDLTIPRTAIDGQDAFIVTEIGDYGFSSCWDLASVIMPNTITTIGEYAFASSGITDLEITDSVTEIGERAFWFCTRLNNVSIGNSLKTIENNAFEECISLSSIKLGNSIEEIRESAFYRCSSLSSITLPQSLMSIGNYAFSKCSNLATINIPDSTFEIGWYAFSDTSISYITFPDSLRSIEDGAFSNCKLTSVFIPTNISNIGANPFAYCPNLNKIEVADNNKHYSEIDGVLYNKDATELLAFPAGKMGRTFSVPSSVKSIGCRGFAGCANLDNIELHNNITEIKEGTFSQCSHLNDFVLPSSITTIGRYAFSNCSALTSIIIPNSVTTIGDVAFEECNSLTSITIPYSIENLGAGVLFCCTGLKEAVLPNSITSLDGGFFYGCSNLESVNIPNSVTYIDDMAFVGCANLHSLYYDANEPKTFNQNLFPETAYSNATLYVPQLAVIKCYTTLPWCLFENIEEHDFSLVEQTECFDTSIGTEVYNLNGTKVSNSLIGLPSGTYIVRHNNNGNVIILK